MENNKEHQTTRELIFAFGFMILAMQFWADRRPFFAVLMLICAAISGVSYLRNMTKK